MLTFPDRFPSPFPCSFPFLSPFPFPPASLQHFQTATTRCGATTTSELRNLTVKRTYCTYDTKIFETIPVGCRSGVCSFMHLQLQLQLRLQLQSQCHSAIEFTYANHLSHNSTDAFFSVRFLSFYHILSHLISLHFVLFYFISFHLILFHFIISGDVRGGQVLECNC